MVTKNSTGTDTEWTWSLTNPNPGNGSNGTLRDVSHWDVSLPAQAEAALVSAEYSFDGVTWHNSPIVVERDFSIKLCTLVDVLKFDAGTTGNAPTYYKAIFDADFTLNPFATSWIKNGGGQQGCNLYYYTGMGSRLDYYLFEHHLKKRRCDLFFIARQPQDSFDYFPQMGKSKKEE